MLRSYLAALAAVTVTLASPIKLDLATRALSKRYTGVRIISDAHNNCLSVEGGATRQTFENGLRVVSLPCDDASLWDINHGSGSILVSANNGFALDAGENPSNNGDLKIWTSYPGQCRPELESRQSS